MSNAVRPENFLLTLVIPCHNEEPVIRATYDRVCEVLGNKKFRLQTVFVNDGSDDGTGRILEQISVSDPRVKVVTLARNFGHQPAVSAGLASADGDAVAVIDADLQDPPEVILEMIDRWCAGFDVVYGIRTKRKEAIWKRVCYSGFYRIFRWVSDIDAPLDAGDFSLIDKEVLFQVNRLPEKNRFFRGLRVWVGFNQTGVCYERQPRAAGTTKYSILRLFTLAADGVFNFSTVPLTVVFILGMMMSIMSMTAALALFVARIFDIPWLGGHLREAQGFASIILTVLLIGGVQLICTGILGEYIGRIYQEVKSRPSYIVRQVSSHQPGIPEEGLPTAARGKSGMEGGGVNHWNR
jgi:polyisoprenyl-phosphate glycosyltransferase